MKFSSLRLLVLFLLVTSGFTVYSDIQEEATEKFERDESFGELVEIAGSRFFAFKFTPKELRDGKVATYQDLLDTIVEKTREPIKRSIDNDPHSRQRTVVVVDVFALREGLLRCNPRSEDIKILPAFETTIDSPEFVFPLGYVEDDKWNWFLFLNARRVDLASSTFKHKNIEEHLHIQLDSLKVIEVLCAEEQAFTQVDALRGYPTIINFVQKDDKRREADSSDEKSESEIEGATELIPQS